MPRPEPAVLQAVKLCIWTLTKPPLESLGTEFSDPAVLLAHAEATVRFGCGPSVEIFGDRTCPRCGSIRIWRLQVFIAIDIFSKHLQD